MLGMTSCWSHRRWLKVFCIVSAEKGSIEQTVSAEMIAAFKDIAWILNTVSWSEPIKHIWDAIGREDRRSNSRNVMQLEQ